MDNNNMVSITSEERLEIDLALQARVKRLNQHDDVRDREQIAPAPFRNSS